MSRATAASGVVCDGFDRWEAGVKAALRAEVAPDFADRLREASSFRWFLIRLEIEAEVARRMKDVKRPPDEALF